MIVRSVASVSLEVKELPRKRKTTSDAKQFELDSCSSVIKKLRNELKHKSHPVLSESKKRKSALQDESVGAELAEFVKKKLKIDHEARAVTNPAELPEAVLFNELRLSVVQGDLEQARYFSRVIANQKRIFPKNMEEKPLSISVAAHLSPAEKVINLAREENSTGRFIEPILILKHHIENPNLSRLERGTACYEMAAVVHNLILKETNEVMRGKYCARAKEFCDRAILMGVDVKGLDKKIGVLVLSFQSGGECKGLSKSHRP